VGRPAILPFLQRLQQECGGSIPFERFMQEALYHPEFGYYTANIRDVGSRGDFSTSATLGDELGTAIARWIESRIRELRWDRGWGRIPVIEIGAGNGSLARTILSKLPWRIRWRLDYMIQETSPVLRHLQRKRLRWHGVHWSFSLSEALNHCKGNALIFSNELVDAFPCRIFEKDPTSWHEIGVTLSPDGSLSEIRSRVTDQIPALEQHSHLSPGQRVEIHESYRDWLSDWRDSWRTGSLLTIDYGEKSETLYTRRPAGSLRGYWNHAKITGPQIYARFGKQDLTADVNFSDLVKWGEEIGLQTRSLETQREFLKRWLPSANTVLTESDGSGSAFMVLEQSTSSLRKN
jgi:SAM-dependent MidA family methyltransferase